MGESSVVYCCHFLNGKAIREGAIVFLFLFCLAGRLSAEEGDTIPDSTANPGDEVEAISESMLHRMVACFDGGLFLPLGSWSEGFDPGVSVGAGIDIPLRDMIDIGGRFSWFTLKRDDLTNFKWLSMETQITFYPPVDFSRAEPFILGRSGLLLAAVEVGEGREDEWDLLVGAGGGVGVPITEDFRFVGTALWRRVMGEGQGFHFTGGLSFPVF